MSDADYALIQSQSKGKSVRKELLYISFKYETGNNPPNKPKLKSGNRPVLCPFMCYGVPCGFTGFNRNFPAKEHDCLSNPPKKIQQKLQFKKATTSDAPTFPLFRPPANQSRANVYQETVLELITDLLSGTSLSLRFACSEFFRDWLRRIIIFGQKNPTVPIELIIPRLSQRKLSDKLTERGDIGLSTILDSIRNKFVSIMFDGTKVNHQKYVAVTVVLHGEEAKPVFLTLVPAPRTKEDYSLFVIEVVKWLGMVPCEVTSICTDGLSAQVSGIELARESVKKEDDVTYAPFHIPCMNHLLNLIIVHSFDNQEDLESIKASLIEFADTASTADKQLKLQKRCPLFIKSRWLSLSLLCSYVRQKRDVIREQTYLTFGQVKSAVTLEVLLLPLYELHLFVENDSTKLHHVFPALIRVLLQYKLLITVPCFRELRWINAIAEILRLLNITIFDTSIGELLALAFAATPIGQYLFSKDRFVSGYNLQTPLEETKQKLFVFLCSSEVIVLQYPSTI